MLEFNLFRCNPPLVPPFNRRGGDNAISPFNKRRGGDNSIFLTLLQKRSMCIIPVLLMLFLFSISVYAADSPRKAARKGIQQYNNEAYDRALAEFIAGMEAAPDRKELHYDMGTALYKLEDLENASSAFAQAAATDNPKLAADAWYNLGNAMFKTGELDKSIQAYKNSLLLNHNDPDTKHNLELALLMKQMQLQQQQQQSQKGDSTGQQQQPKPQPRKDDGDQEQQQQKQAEADSSREEQEQPQPQPEKKTDMTPEEALQLLQALEHDEQEAQKEKLERQYGKPKRVEKDW